MPEPTDPMDRLIWLTGGARVAAQVRRLRRALARCIVAQRDAATQMDGSAPQTLTETTANAERVLRETDE